MVPDDCPKCWNTPCTCGYEYRHWTDDKIKGLIKKLNDLLEFRSNMETVRERKKREILAALSEAEWPWTIKELRHRFDPNRIVCSEQTVRDYLAMLRHDGKVIITNAWGMTFYELRRAEDTT